MRKSLLFLLLCLSFVTFSAFQKIEIVYAADIDVDGICAIDETSPPEEQLICTDGVCNAPPMCKPGLRCVADKAGDSTKHCRPKNPNAPNVNLSCKCQNSNVDGDGKNGFVCNGPDGKPDNSKVVYCNGASRACVDSSPESVTHVETTENGSQHYPGASFHGVVCEQKRPIANCKCIGRGTDKENNFECTVDDPATPEVEQLTGTAFCGDVKFQCTDVPNFIYTGPTRERTGLFNEPRFSSGVTMKGIQCSQPSGTCTCKHPGRSGSRMNGFTCTQQVGGLNLKDSTYCDSPLDACIPKEAGYTMTKKPETPIFNAAPLKGIECEPRQPLPPPPPPCAEPLDNLGKCLAFDSAFGKISTDAGAFLTSLFALLLSGSGAIAVLLIMRAGYILLTSAGNPEKVKTGQDQLTAAIVGLLFIIFSFVILQVIGVEILKIPGLSSGSAVTTGSVGGPGGLGGTCDMNNNSCQPGLTCVSNTGGRQGTCKPSTGASCNVNGNNQCPTGQSCVNTGVGVQGTCQ